MGRVITGASHYDSICDYHQKSTADFFFLDQLSLSSKNMWDLKWGHFIQE